MNLSPAMLGLLQSLPSWPRPFPPGERERWLAALKAVLDMDYPPPEEPPPVSNDFVAPGCEQFSATGDTNA